MAYVTSSYHLSITHKYHSRTSKTHIFDAETRERFTTMNGRKEAGTEVVVEVLVFAHVIHLLPLGLGHLFLHQFWCHLFLVWVETSILEQTRQTCIFKRCANHHHRLQMIPSKPPAYPRNNLKAGMPWCNTCCSMTNLDARQRLR